MDKFTFMLKWILTVGILAFFQTANATEVSTDTEKFIPFIVPAVEETIVQDVPVEHKVVELKITPKVVIAEESTKKSRRIKNLPHRPLMTATCSGAFVTEFGDILTARHCVDIGTDIDIYTHDRRRYSATVIATSSVHDLALIHIDKRNTPYFTLAKKVERGQPINILGSPLSITDVQAVGTVARLDGDLLLVDCSALPGNSGGPVFDHNKELVGILTNGYMYGFGVTHLNVAQGIDAVHFFLESVREKLPWAKGEK